ncbi:hypothetical protein FGU71_02215 [Erythrobacter insulae]|uniref:Autotransporter outer membrane beta-barrel domain-containing protein n=1 Tax=Erythrobacter insulae TaxID=2584124 RepID=A0A547P9G6_9SPHN|nr:hypothetical protein [Erythrobacter insulae]TRD10798.1 hypothetical protein FGU71_02215 [Erythrobacter insulae]
MTHKTYTSRRGSPLIVLGLVFAVWAGGRAMTWENPFPIALPFPTAQTLFADANSRPVSSAPVNKENKFSVFTKGGRSQIDALPAQFAARPGMEGTVSVQTDPDISFGHHMLWLKALGAKLPLGETPMHATKAPEQLAGVTPIAPPIQGRSKPGRWSFDTWGFWRAGSSSTAISQGRVPIYGASQIGANLQYRINPSSLRDPRIYARAYRAMVDNGESELAAGASARPIGAVPVRLAAEWRVTQTRFSTNVRPAVMAITELPPQKLPANFQLEAYGGAGYVGGEGATAFADGQAAVTRKLVNFSGPADTNARLSLGAGAWGGAQEGAARMDVGPTMRLDLTLGEVPARLSIDWRERVGGDASPGSGVAATLSTRF